MTIAGERVAAIRRGIRARHTCRRCEEDWGCEPAAHMEEPIARFGRDAVAQYNGIMVDGYTSQGWVVEYADGSMSLYTDDGCYEEYAMVVRGAARAQFEAAIQDKAAPAPRRERIRK